MSSDEHFVLCYKRKNNPSYWECEKGYQSITESNIRINKLFMSKNEYNTFIYPYKRNCLFLDWRIKYQLTKLTIPTIKYVSRPSIYKKIINNK